MDLAAMLRSRWAIFTVLLVTGVLSVASQNFALKPFWDYQIYDAAMSCFHDGCNPYTANLGRYRFVYPPVFLRVFAPFNFTVAYSLLILSMLVIGLWRLSDVAGRADVAIAGFLTSATGVLSLLTGNLTLFAHLLVIGLSLHAFQRAERWGPALGLAAAVFVISVIKPYFLAYALILLVLRPRRIALFAAVIAGVALATAAQAFADPELWRSFKASLIAQTFSRGDLGFTLFSPVYEKTGALIVGVGAHLAVIGALALATVALLLRGERRPWRAMNASELFYCLALAIVLNPRLKEYDLSALMACVYLSVYLAPKRDVLTDLALLVGLPLLTVATTLDVLLARHLGIDTPLSLAVSYFLAIYGGFAVASWNLWRSHRSSGTEPATV